LNDKRRYIFDACALIALLRRETGVENIEALLVTPSVECSIHAVNLCEVAYDAMRRQPGLDLEEWTSEIEAFGLRIHWNVDYELLKGAASLKAHWRRVALADCFALALARRLDGTLLTSDHHELDPLVAAGETGISFFR
jgi:PIN domain nuclease of toxin-antitoxin system